MKLLTKDAILKADDQKFEYVEVPEWAGGDPEARVRVRGLTATERDAFEGSLVKRRGKETEVTTADIRAKLCARAMVDADGKRLFDDSDIGMLGAKSAAALDRVYEVASRLSKMSEADVEELAGNSKSAPSDAS